MSLAEPKHFDVVIVGGGFAGCYLLYHLRKRGLSCHLLESSPRLGGVWASNNYPGARVDTSIPMYEYAMPEVWQGWTWSEMYPGREELVRYFQHVDQRLAISADTSFNTWVNSADWNDSEKLWHVKGSNDTHIVAKYFLPCVGFASKRYTPALNNLSDFAGLAMHTADWPEGVDLRNKRVAVIGTGASGVQVIQEIAHEVKKLVVYQRTPNMALPMVQSKLNASDQLRDQATLYHDKYKHRLTTFSGLSMNIFSGSTFDYTPAEQTAYFDKLYALGGFAFWLSAYQDLNTDQKANDVAYAYWVEQTRKRIADPTMAELLAPTISPHAFGTKRPSLEMSYWECYNRENVELVAVKQDPILTITTKGIVTAARGEDEFDVIVLASGFDGVTGGLTQIDIRGKDGVTVRDQWAKGCSTFLGMACPNYPNMFFPYGPQAPTAFGNGPPTCELQGDWILRTIDYLEQNGKKTLEPTFESAAAWTMLCDDMAAGTLFPNTEGWYMGTNIPGKVKQSLMYLGGLPNYRAAVNDEADKGYPGFQMT